MEKMTRYDKIRERAQKRAQKAQQEGKCAEKREWKRRERREPTHRKGKPLLTKEMIRELKNYTNPLEQLILIMNKCFPWLLDELADLNDVRNESYTDYNMQEITVIRLIALCCGIQNMSRITKQFNRDEFIENINKILGTELKKVPCDNTISDVINTLNIPELESLQAKMIRKLIESKTLDKFRLFNGSFYIVLDGTGMFSRRKEGNGCVYKVYNKDTEDEYTEYHYYVLEAKLVCGDYVFSFATEFVENENMSSEQDKQDCELKAAHRLLDKIRKAFPKLPITIGGDALFANKPFMDACKSKSMDYIIRYKETVMKTLYEEFKNIPKTIKGDYEYVNNIGYGSGTKATEGTTNLIRFVCHDKDSEQTEEYETVDKTAISKGTEFMFITSLKINKDNYQEIVVFGRRRWKIENQGFKAQKSKILNIGHAYTYDSNGIKANYLFIQYAHTLLTILFYGSAIIKRLKESNIEICHLLYEALLKPQELSLENSIQIRFD